MKNKPNTTIKTVHSVEKRAVKRNIRPLLEEIEMIVHDREAWLREGIWLNIKSIATAKRFAELVIPETTWGFPEVEVSEDGGMEFIWRDPGVGVVTIAFDEYNQAMWSVALKKPQRIAHGRFIVGSYTPPALIAGIAQIRG